MKILIFFSKLFCKHSEFYTKTEYRVYDSMYRNIPVKRYEVLNVERCNECDKLINSYVVYSDLTKGRLKQLKKLTNEQINSIKETIK